MPLTQRVDHQQARHRQKTLAADRRRQRQKIMIEGRRKFLAIAGLAPVAALLGAREVFAQAGAACYDMSKMSLAQKNMRRSVGFVDPAPDLLRAAVQGAER